jgi:hypothetical protein
MSSGIARILTYYVDHVLGPTLEFPLDVAPLLETARVRAIGHLLGAPASDAASATASK